jgi:hypothetical protein
VAISTDNRPGGHHVQVERHHFHHGRRRECHALPSLRGVITTWQSRAERDWMPRRCGKYPRDRHVRSAPRDDGFHPRRGGRRRVANWRWKGWPCMGGGWFIPTTAIPAQISPSCFTPFARLGSVLRHDPDFQALSQPVAYSASP